jgi:hypothetical protein
MYPHFVPGEIVFVKELIKIGPHSETVIEVF